MDAEKIRELRLADPFKPFNLIMKDGRKLPVDKAYFLAMSEDGKLIVHSSLDGGFEDLGPDSVAAVDFKMTRHRRRRSPGRRKGAA